MLTKLDPTGNTIFSTYLGGNGTDYAGRLATDAAGNVYLTGYTSSTNFPTTAGAYQPTNHGSTDGYVTKISAQRVGDSVVYLPGRHLRRASRTTSPSTAAGNIYLTGFTGSPDFPTLNPFQATSIRWRCLRHQDEPVRHRPHILHLPGRRQPARAR